MKQTTKPLGDSQSVLLSLLSLTDDGVVIVDADGMVTEINEVAATMLGWADAASALGSAFEDAVERANLTDGFGRPMARDELRQRVSEKPLGVRARLRPPRRRQARSVRISMAPASGGLEILLFRDLSTLVAAEDAAHQYKRTADVALDAIYIALPDSLRIVYANEGATRQSGWSREALTDRTLDDLVPLLDLRSIRHAIDSGDGGGALPATVPTVLRARNGDLRPVDVLLQPLELDGGASQILAVARDATERVESQAKLQRLVQQERVRTAELEATLAAIGDAVVVCDVDGTVILANPATHDVFAHARIRSYTDLLAVLDDPEGRAPALGSPDRQGPIEVMVRGRPERWLELSAFPVASPTEDAPDGTIFLARDVTAARETRRMREAFLGILSHELRTPVTTILAGSKVLGRRQHLSAETRDDLIQDIEAEAERLYRLVEDLLVLARFDEHQPDAVANEPLLLQRILPTLLTSEEARWPGRRFTLDIPKGLATVRGDRTYVDQVVRNMLGNAAKYSPVDDPIEVAVHEVDGWVRVCIRDRGPGFQSEEADRLFDLYYRSPGTLTMAAGAGIGLFVCRRLIEAMGGQIWARPRDGGGAEFGFALRVLDEEDL